MPMIELGGNIVQYSHKVWGIHEISQADKKKCIQISPGNYGYYLVCQFLIILPPKMVWNKVMLYCHSFIKCYCEGPGKSGGTEIKWDKGFWLMLMMWI
jgi:hypothetical protein